MNKFDFTFASIFVHCMAQTFFTWYHNRYEVQFHLFSQLKCLHNVFLSDIFSTRIEFGCCLTRTAEHKHFCWSMILDSQLRPKAGFVDHVVTVSRYIVCERKKENTARLAMCSCRHVQFSCVCIINLKLASSPDNVIMFGCSPVIGFRPTLHRRQR